MAGIWHVNGTMALRAEPDADRTVAADGTFRSER